MCQILIPCPECRIWHAKCHCPRKQARSSASTTDTAFISPSSQTALVEPSCQPNGSKGSYPTRRMDAIYREPPKALQEYYKNHPEEKEQIDEVRRYVNEHLRDIKGVTE